jgi:hypothetical protein
MSTYNFDAILPGDTDTTSFRFSTEKKRDVFISGGLKLQDLEVELNYEMLREKGFVTDQQVISSALMKAPSLSGTIDAMLESLTEVTKISIDQKVGAKIIHQLIYAQENLEKAFLYLTDKSYKGDAE